MELTVFKMNLQQHITTLSEWREMEKAALELLQIIGDLRFDRSIELILFRHGIYDARPSEVLDLHLNSKKYVEEPISIYMSLELAKGIAKMDLAPSRIDIGKLAIDRLVAHEQFADVDAFLTHHLGEYIGQDKKTLTPKDVVLYGFGRIGRLAARRIVEMTGKGEQLRLRAIVIRPKLSDRHAEMDKRAALLRNDSVHGKFRGTVEVAHADGELIINGNRVKMIFAKQPQDIDYTMYGIKNALVIDNTGVWRDKAALSVHLRPGVQQVLLTAPGKGVPNIVHGVNQKTVDFQQDTILSAASCTTNAIAPVIQVIDDAYGISQGHIESIHSYTNDQNLIDNFHKKPRRGRGAPVNMVLTSTGAATAIAKVIPHLAGKLTGNAIRVPTPNVSLAILNLQINKTVTVEEVNALVKQHALHGALVEQIQYSTSEDFVSSDAVGAEASSVFDAPSTKVAADGKTVTLYAWYDNEYGYTCQVLRFAKYISQVRRLRYY